MFITCCKTRIEKVVHSVATALTLNLALALTLSLNDLANQLLRMTSTLYGLMYLTNGSVTDYEYGGVQ